MGVAGLAPPRTTCLYARSPAGDRPDAVVRQGDCRDYPQADPAQAIDPGITAVNPCRIQRVLVCKHNGSTRSLHGDFFDQAMSSPATGIVRARFAVAQCQLHVMFGEVSTGHGAAVDTKPQTTGVSFSTCGTRTNAARGAALKHTVIAVPPAQSKPWHGDRSGRATKPRARRMTSATARSIASERSGESIRRGFARHLEGHPSAKNRLYGLSSPVYRASFTPQCFSGPRGLTCNLRMNLGMAFHGRGRAPPVLLRKIAHEHTCSARRSAWRRPAWPACSSTTVSCPEMPSFPL